MDLGTEHLYFIEKSYKKNTFTIPTVIGCYSISGINKVFSSDAKQLKYWNKNCPQEGKVCINLNDNPENHIRAKHNYSPETLNNRDLFQFLWMEKQRFPDIFKDDAITISKAPIVCSRKNLGDLSSLPYKSHQSVTISCCLYRGIIYLYGLREAEKLSDSRVKSSNWGHKFEKFVLADSPRSHPDTSEPVIHHECASLVLRADLNEHHLIYNAEIDGVVVCNEDMVFSNISGDELSFQLNNSKFVELKTRNQIITDNHQRIFSKYKTMQWWLHSLFGRNEFILCGIKDMDTDGMVCEIKKYDVKSLPLHSNGFWNSNVCLNSCNSFLSHMKRYFTEELQKLNIDEKNIRSAPKIEFVLEKTPDSYNIKKLKNPEGFTVLPKWYEDSIENMEELRSKRNRN